MKRGMKPKAMFEVRTHSGEYVGYWSSLSTARKHMLRGCYCIKYLRYNMFAVPVKYYLFQSFNRHVSC